MPYPKLVRDKIPEMLERKGKNPEVHIASDDKEYYSRLKDKLLEEANEFLEDESDQTLADIIEVVYAIGSFRNLTKEELELLRKKKNEERGGFGKRAVVDRI